MHSTIERRVRSLPELFLLSQLATTIQMARKIKTPYVVKEVSTDDIKDFKSLAALVFGAASKESGRLIMASPSTGVTTWLQMSPDHLQGKCSSKCHILMNSRKSRAADEEETVMLKKLKTCLIPPQHIRPQVPEEQSFPLTSTVILCNSSMANIH